MKVNGRGAGFQAYLLAICGLRRETRNSHPRIGSSLGESPRVSPGSSLGGSHPRSLEESLPESLVLGLGENFVGNGVRSVALSPDRSGVVCGAVSPDRCSVLCSPISSPVSSAGCLRMSFPMSFQVSFVESFGRAVLRFPACATATTLRFHGTFLTASRACISYAASAGRGTEAERWLA